MTLNSVKLDQSTLFVLRLIGGSTFTIITFKERQLVRDVQVWSICRELPILVVHQDLVLLLLSLLVLLRTRYRLR